MTRTFLAAILVFAACGGESEERTEVSPVTEAEVRTSASQGPTSYFSPMFEAERAGEELPFRRLSAPAGQTSVELFLSANGNYLLVAEPARDSGQFIVAEGSWSYDGWDVSLSGVGFLRLVQSSGTIGTELVVQETLRGYRLQGQRYPLSRIWSDWDRDQHLRQVRAEDPRAAP